jgi:hypothetical protein
MALSAEMIHLCQALWLLPTLVLALALLGQGVLAVGLDLSRRGLVVAGRVGRLLLAHLDRRWQIGLILLLSFVVHGISSHVVRPAAMNGRRC